MSNPQTENGARWGLIIGAMALVLVLIVSGATLISFIGGSETTAQEEVIPKVVRDERNATRDQLGRTVFTPVNEAGDVLERVNTGPDENSSTYYTARPDVEWQRLSGKTEQAIGRDYPYSAVAGPWEITEGVAHGFAHSPQGAALAGIHMLNGVAQGGEKAARASRQFVDDEKTVEMMNLLLSEPEAPELPEMPWARTFASYLVVDYDKDAATIRYGLADGGGYASWDISLHWADGDWKMSEESVAEELEPVTERQMQSWVVL